RQSKDDAINAARQTLSVCWFDVAECDEGLKALRSYRKEWDEEKGIWRDTPRHDRASHGADAFQTLSVWWRDMREEERPHTVEINCVASRLSALRRCKLFLSARP